MSQVTFWLHLLQCHNYILYWICCHSMSLYLQYRNSHYFYSIYCSIGILHDFTWFDIFNNILYIIIYPHFLFTHILFYIYYCLIFNYRHILLRYRACHKSCSDVNYLHILLRYRACHISCSAVNYQHILLRYRACQKSCSAVNYQHILLRYRACHMSCSAVN